MAAFILSCIVHNYPAGQEAALTNNVISICLEQLTDRAVTPVGALLRKWSTICLGRVWDRFDAARWCGVRDSAHEKLYPLLTDSDVEVRN